MSHNVSKEKAGDQKAEAMLRYLRGLVTALAVVMGAGIVAITAILWLRLGAGTGAGAPLPDLPAQIDLPQGAAVQALTFARDWIIVVTDGGEVLLFDRSGHLHQRLEP